MHSWYHIKWITFLTPKTSTSRSVSHIFTHNLLVCYDWRRRLRPFVMRLPLHIYFMALIETYWPAYSSNTISCHRKTIEIYVFCYSFFHFLFVLLIWYPLCAIPISNRVKYSSKWINECKYNWKGQRQVRVLYVEIRRIIYIHGKCYKLLEDILNKLYWWKQRFSVPISWLFSQNVFLASMIFKTTLRKYRSMH